MSQSLDDLDSIVGPPIELSDDVLKACIASGKFGPPAFDLYKEALGLACVSSSIVSGDSLEVNALHIDQAICAGLLVRISKLMGSIIKLSADTEYGETVEVINRCVIESSIDLRFLLAKNDPNLFERFVKHGLVAERELYNLIQANVDRRGGKVLEIEAGMLKSIINMCDSSGVRIEDVPQKRAAWGGSMRDKLRALNMDSAYVVLQMLPSHAIHGTWADLIRHHLLRNADGFEATLEWTRTDGKHLGPTALLVIEAVQDYLARYFDVVSVAPISERLESLKERIVRLEETRPGWEAAEE